MTNTITRFGTRVKGTSEYIAYFYPTEHLASSLLIYYSSTTIIIIIIIVVMAKKADFGKERA